MFRRIGPVSVLAVGSITAAVARMEGAQVRRKTARTSIGLVAACAGLLVLVAPVRADTVTDWN